MSPPVWLLKTVRLLETLEYCFIQQICLELIVVLQLDKWQR